MNKTGKGNLAIGIFFGDIWSGDSVQFFEHGQVQVGEADERGRVWVTNQVGDRVRSALDPRTPVFLLHRRNSGVIRSGVVHEEHLRFEAYSQARHIVRYHDTQAEALGRLGEAIMAWQLSRPLAVPITTQEEG